MGSVHRLLALGEVVPAAPVGDADRAAGPLVSAITCTFIPCFLAHDLTTAVQTAARKAEPGAGRPADRRRWRAATPSICCAPAR